MPYDFHSLVDWAGTVRFKSLTTIARHEKFKQLLDKYWSEDFLSQQLSLKNLNVNVHYHNNALAQLNDYI